MAVLRWYVPPILLAICPLTIVLGANLGVEPLRAEVITRSLAVTTTAAIVVLWMLRWVQRDLTARAMWLAAFVMLFNLYGASVQGLQRLNLAIHASDPLFAVPYVLTSAVIAAKHG